MPDTVPRRLREVLGPQWSVAAVASPADSDGDGASGSAEALELVRGAEVYVGWGVHAAVVEAGRASLKWVHSAGAGVGGSLGPGLRDSGLVLTNSAGVHAEPIAEWVLAALLVLFRGLDLALRAQLECRWAKDELTAHPLVVRELAGSVLVVYGLGGIGGAVARRAVGLGMTVRGVRRRPELGGPAGVAVSGADRLDEALRDADALVVAAPLTGATRGRIGVEELGWLRRGAVVVNVSRGAVLDEDALVAGLREGWLGGAAVDVFTAEPLPADHPLWRQPRVLVSPHVSAVSPRFWERETAFLLANFARYLAGRPLANVVDQNAGY